MTTSRRNLFFLGEKLGIPVSELEKRLKLSEYFEWLDYFSYEPEIPAPTAGNILKGFGL